MKHVSVWNYVYLKISTDLSRIFKCAQCATLFFPILGYSSFTLVFIPTSLCKNTIYRTSTPKVQWSSCEACCKLVIFRV